MQCVAIFDIICHNLTRKLTLYLCRCIKNQTVYTDLRNYNFRFQEKNLSLERDSNLRPQIPSLALNYISYPGLVDGTGILFYVIINI